MFCLFSKLDNLRRIVACSILIFILLTMGMVFFSGCIFQSSSGPSKQDPTLGLWAGYGENSETLRFFLFPGSMYMIFSLTDSTVTFGETGYYSVSGTHFYLSPVISYTAEGDTSMPIERHVPYLLSPGKLEIKLAERIWEVYHCNRDLEPTSHWGILGSWTLTDVPVGQGSILAFFCRSECYRVVEENGILVRLDAGKFSFDGYQLHIGITFSSDELIRGTQIDFSAYLWENNMELEEERGGFVYVTQWLANG